MGIFFTEYANLVLSSQKYIDKYPMKSFSQMKGNLAVGSPFTIMFDDTVD